jgi:hypothetical protein
MEQVGITSPLGVRVPQRIQSRSLPSTSFRLRAFSCSVSHRAAGRPSARSKSPDVRCKHIDVTVRPVGRSWRAISDSPSPAAWRGLLQAQAVTLSRMPVRIRPSGLATLELTPVLVRAAAEQRSEQRDLGLGVRVDRARLHRRVADCPSATRKDRWSHCHDGPLVSSVSHRKIDPATE